MPERDLAISERRVARELVTEVSSSTTVIQSNAAFIGQIIMYCSATAPSDGWLLCDGSAISRTAYADLFAIMGTSFGVGDGSTTFNLPDLGQVFPLGYKEGVNNVGDTGGSYDHSHSGGSHTHSFSDGFTTSTAASPYGVPLGSSNYVTGQHSHTGTASGTTGSGGGGSGTANPPFAVIGYWIKAES